ncbi:MAG: hypothetical protein IK012_08785 [Fibrobacter sp.]|uniref:hypothetical protein n=1 Tax=Fibrobacter sp. TaxID=35828 RepID=UPI0025BB3586|nr:hypothetical protein [Fibrobacter sp.]MBR4785329.1 hypothetical protein [Fibrobacter sp.]
MILQPILFPREDICTETELYYRSNSKQFGCNFFLSPHQTISFDTYFNSFSIENWKEYTSITNLFLNLKIQGRCFIELFEATLVNGTIQNRLLATHEKNEIEESITISFPDIANIHGICFFTISSKDESCRIIEGFYGTRIYSDSTNSIKIGIGICTYKRESFVLKNLKAIQDTILDNPQSELYNKLDIIISDNGQTLHNFNYHHPKVQIFPNINAGGSGGFARCMIEAISHNLELNLTHFILMDDDILLDPAVLVRTFCFLRCLRVNFRTKILGGAMLKSENMSEQAINGCIWSPTDGVRFSNPNSNLSNVSSILKNLNNKEPNFAPWFYCCIPIQYIRKDNLPLPFFFQYDDTEFSLRESSTVILLNGISVWHSFLSKDNMCKQYCSYRNSRILKLLKKTPGKILATKKEMTLSFINLVGTYRYLDWIALSQAEIDLWQGTKSLKNKKTIVFCQKAIKTSYPQCGANKISTKATSFSTKKSDDKTWSFLKKIFFAANIFNTLLPKLKKDVIVLDSNDLTPDLFRLKKIIYFRQNEDIYTIYQSNFKLFLWSILQFTKVLFHLRPSEATLQTKLRKEIRFITSTDFWQSYLV